MNDELDNFLGNYTTGVFITAGNNIQAYAVYS